MRILTGKPNILLSSMRLTLTDYSCKCRRVECFAKNSQVMKSPDKREIISKQRCLFSESQNFDEICSGCYLSVMVSKQVNTFNSHASNSTDQIIKRIEADFTPFAQSSKINCFVFLGPSRGCCDDILQYFSESLKSDEIKRSCENCFYPLNFKRNEHYSNLH